MGWRGCWQDQYGGFLDWHGCRLDRRDGVCVCVCVCFFFFSLGGSCGGCFLWLLLVAILMVFGGWHGGDYCGCGSCWPVVWWVC